MKRPYILLLAAFAAVVPAACTLVQPGPGAAVLQPASPSVSAIEAQMARTYRRRMENVRVKDVVFQDLSLDEGVELVRELLRSKGADVPVSLSPELACVSHQYRIGDLCLQDVSLLYLVDVICLRTDCVFSFAVGKGLTILPR